MTKTVFAGAALAAMLAQSACPAQAFQPVFLMSPSTAGKTAAYSPVMGCSSPWDDASCNNFGMRPFNVGPRRRRGGRSLGRSFLGGPPAGQGVIFAPQSYAPALDLGEPAITNTDEAYKLTFKMPDSVTQDDLDISVSDRVLTVKARVTREDESNGGSWGGWVSRSSRTDSVARSFVLPEDVATAGVTASKVDNGGFEVRFNKKAIDGKQPAADSAEGVKARSVASASADYLSGLSSKPTVEGQDQQQEVQDAAVTSSASEGDIPVSTSEANAQGAKDGDEASKETETRRPRTVFDALDAEFGTEFGQFAKMLWGEEAASAFRIPTQEEMAAQVERAREQRARRVMAMRRRSMAADVSEKDGSYVVR